MDFETTNQSIAETLDVATGYVALFDQYDDTEVIEEANEDWCENLYPNVA